MKNSLFNFKDDEEREMFFIAIPVILFFAVLGYWLTTDGSAPDAVVAEVPVTRVVSDIDADGVADHADRCIGTAGDIANQGCPAKIPYAQADNDNDGIRNGIDRCPETSGDAANNGCRVAAVSTVSKMAAAPAVVATTMATETVESVVDSDGDGVADAIDKCPDVAGADVDLGCPADADNDGVLGDADACPDAAGSAIDNGCPADADGDGVMDMDDPCPMIAGTVGGCPADQDNDGVIDAEDQCPEESGSAASSGCPIDSDGDGVTDAADRCPDTAGDASNDGCAVETDAADVAATDSETATVDTDTDTDGDGVADSLDYCPDLAGDIANNGCPAESDSDGDGVIDSQDQCTDESGPASNQGCPVTASDIDGDTVPDSIDRCPTIAGVAEENGCPMDSDGDGIADGDDLCPATAGTIASRGCPEVIADNALSQQDQQILDSALALVAFNSNSAVLTRKSQNILQEVAGLLRKYPEARLEIRGHTDSSGPAARNMELSMQRARSAANYISQQGIDITRLVAYGYGESQPIASNNTRDGKRTNRRVEFELKFNQ